MKDGLKLYPRWLSSSNDDEQKLSLKQFSRTIIQNLCQRSLNISHIAAKTLSNHDEILSYQKLRIR